jgi:dGTPase
VDEPDAPTRTCFQRDRDRVVHSSAFRRLKHKTQVFVYHVGDHYRTRLTHTIEVSQIARSIARVLGLDEDLTEALALAHDLGHPPFGHAGEDVLDRCMAPYGGFDHNIQTLRIVTMLERRYASFDGLNLTWECLEGIVKHNGPLSDLESRPATAARYLVNFCSDYEIDMTTFASAEAQVAALADDIAYNNHDLDDGLRASLFSIGDLAGLPVVGDVFREVNEKFPGLERRRLIHESIRRLIAGMVNDLIAESTNRINAVNPQSADDVRSAGRPLVAFSEDMARHNRTIKDFLFRNMYRHEMVKEMIDKAHTVVAALFDAYIADLALLPEELARRAAGVRREARARQVADYIAGMTDRFAMAAYHRLHGTHFDEKD